MTNKMSREELISYLKTTKDDIKTRRKVVLDNTVAYFGESGQCGNYGDCFYYPSNDFEGCAYGRLLPLDEALKMPEGSLYGLIGAKGYEVPEYLKELGLDFLDDLQSWHDLVPARQAFYDLLTRFL